MRGRDRPHDGQTQAQAVRRAVPFVEPAERLEEGWGEPRTAGEVLRRRERGAQPPRRDRRLSRAAIVGVAIAVADAEGPDAISVRRIARSVRA